MKNFVEAFVGLVAIVAVLAVIIGGMAILIYYDGKTEREARALIEKCELEIARNKKCKLIAVVNDNT